MSTDLELVASGGYKLSTKVRKLRIEELTATAEKWADAKAGPKPRGHVKRPYFSTPEGRHISDRTLDEWARAWNRAYHDEMDRLTHAEGIRTSTNTPTGEAKE